MTSTYTPTPISAGFGQETAINTNNTDIKTALDGGLTRASSASNTMLSNLDMNSNDIDNCSTLNTTILKIAGVEVTTSTVTTTASDITNVAAGNISSTDVQSAINELDTEKSASAHTHLLATITDSGTAASKNVGTSALNVVQLDGSAKIPAVDGSQLTNLLLTEDFTSSEQTITAAGSLTIAHSLSSTPELVQLHIINKTAELNYSIGDVLLINPAGNAIGAVSQDYGNSVVLDSTNINVRFGADTAVYEVLNKTTGVSATITPANWKLVIKAWA